MYNTKKTFVALFAFAAIALGAEAQNKKTSGQSESNSTSSTKEVLVPAETKPTTKDGGKAVTTPAGTDKPTQPKQEKKLAPPPAPATPPTPSTPASKQPVQGSTPASPSQVESSNSLDEAPASTLEPKAVQNKNVQRNAPARKGK